VAGEVPILANQRNAGKGAGPRTVDYAKTKPILSRPTVRNKANCPWKTRPRRPRRGPGSPLCETKPISGAGACTTICGERGRSPYHAKQSQFPGHVGRD